MAEIYVSKWEAWTTTKLHLLKYDTDNIRNAFKEMSEWDDDKIIEYLKENGGHIEFEDNEGRTGDICEVIENGEGEEGIEISECQNDEPSGAGTQVFTNPDNWDTHRRRAWWYGSNDLRCEDRSAEFDKVFSNFTATMATYKFEE